MDILDVPPLVWPLIALLVMLLVARQVRNELSPLVSSVIGGLAIHAAKHSLAYAMAFLYATAASLQALADVSREQSWVYVEAACRVLQPGCVAIIAFVRPSVAQTNGTSPPFPK